MIERMIVAILVLVVFSSGVALLVIERAYQ